MELFETDFSAILQDRMFIFCIQIYNEIFHHGIVKQPYLAYSSCICLVFFLSILCKMKILVIKFTATVQARVVIFCMQVDMNLLYLEIKNQSSLV